MTHDQLGPPLSNKFFSDSIEIVGDLGFYIRDRSRFLASEMTFSFRDFFLTTFLGDFWMTFIRDFFFINCS